MTTNAREVGSSDPGRKLRSFPHPKKAYQPVARVARRFFSFAWGNSNILHEAHRLAQERGEGPGARHRPGAFRQSATFGARGLRG